MLKAIKEAQKPINATVLGEAVGVSRQIIVGDVALLRCQGHEIMATVRGYTMSNAADVVGFRCKIACKHDPQDTKEELYTIVDLGATVVDVIVFHAVYGDITGQLDIKTREDVDTFLNKLNYNKVKLLSELSNGVHLHSIIAKDKEHFEEVRGALRKKGYLMNESS